MNLEACLGSSDPFVTFLQYRQVTVSSVGDKTNDGGLPAQSVQVSFANPNCFILFAFSSRQSGHLQTVYVTNSCSNRAARRSVV